MNDTKSTLQVGMASHQGLRGTENDDSVAWFAVARPDRGVMVHVAVVADGVTSTSAGAQASRIAVEAIEAALRELPDPQETLSEWLSAAIRSANDEILFEAKRNPAWQGMSTTVVVAALAGERLYVLHLGDSRAYLVRGGRLFQLTIDHTWAQAAVAAGALTAVEAAHHPGRNQLQRYLGGSKQINVARGLLSPESGQLEEYLNVQPGDQVLLCSDGIYHRLNQTTLQAIVNEQAGEPQAAVNALIAAAVEQGEVDDITALLFTVPAFKYSTGGMRSAATSLTLDEEVTRPAGAPYQMETSRTKSPVRTWGLIAAAVVLVVLTVYLLNYSM